MTMLADRLKVQKHHLTEVMNADMGMNFFQYVNKYRVEAVKEMLADPKNHFSVKAIGYECGFSSKSSFYSVFKNLTGLTPLQYKSTQLSI